MGLDGVLLGGGAAVADVSGLLVPAAGVSPFAELLGLTPVAEPRELPLVHVYLSAHEYLAPYFAAKGISYRPDLVRLDVLYRHPRDLLLAMLAVLNHASSSPALAEQIRQEYVQRLTPIEPYLGAALRGLHGKPREFLARGPILRAIRDVLANAESDEIAVAARRTDLGFPSSPPVDLLVTAIVLVHITADAMGAQSDSSEPKLAGLPRSLAMELIQNSLFNRSEDAGDQLARNRLMWHNPDIATLKPPPRCPPVEMLQQAAGVDFDTLVAAGFALWSYAQQYSLTSRPVLAADALCFSSAALTATAFGVLSAAPDQLAAEVRANTADWQMLALQTHPVLRLPTGYLVLDETFLLDRITSGLFWIVQEAEKRRGGDSAAEAWHRVHGGMFELLAEQRARRLAPILLGAAQDTFFTEEDLQRHFPGQGRKHCDIGIDFGTTVLLADAVSGQISVPTRTTGDTMALAKDLERIVYKKTRQLDDTAKRLLQDTAGTCALLGRPAARIHPVVIHAGQFPHSPPVTTIIGTQLRTENLLNERDARIAPVSVLSIEDLEVAELVRETRGLALPDILDAWKQSAYETNSLRNYLIETNGLHGPRPRSAASKAELDPHIDKVGSLLKSAQTAGSTTP